MAPERRVFRNQMPAAPGGYVEAMKQDKSGRIHWLDSEDALFEFMLNALRLQQGFDLSLFQLRTGLEQAIIESVLESLINQELITVSEHNWLQLTSKGQQYLNNVVSAFLNE